MYTSINNQLPSSRYESGDASQDKLQSIQFPDNLTGREKETGQVMDIFRNVSGGYCALTLISGSAGVGKTALVKNISERVTEAGALFVSGKADQYNSDIPYRTYIEAVKTLIKHLLLLDEKTLASLNKKLSRTLNRDIQILSDFIPEMKLVTGNPAKNRKDERGNPEIRFKNACSAFISATASLYRGLVLFFDDLHWVDSATITLIMHLVEEKIPGLFIIGAFRDSEVHEGHKLFTMISELNRSSDALHVIKLDALQYKDAENIICTALNDNPSRIKKLTSFIYNKTAGNPFYLREFLQNLVSRGCLQPGKTRWQWDEIKSMEIPATENVLDLLSGMIKTLPDSEQDILKTAACIGGSFSTELLELTADCRPGRLAAILNRLEKENYIITTAEPGIHMFSHDNIQEAAYELISDTEKHGLHKKIGTMLLTLYGTDDEHIFAISDHFNRAGNDAINPAELADLNYKAGLKAKRNFAYGAAVNYLEKSRSLLQNSASKDRVLFFTISSTYCESLYLNSEYEKAEKVILATISMTDKVIEKADLYNILVMIKILQMKYDESVVAGLEALKLFDINFEITPGMREKSIDDIRLNLTPVLNKISVDDILNLPECRRADIHKITQILKNLSGSLYHMEDWKFSFIMHSTTIRLTLEHGITDDSAEGFIGYAMISIVLWNEISLGYKLGSAAWRLSLKYKILSQLGDVSLHYAAYILFWKNHLKHTLDIMITGLDASIKSGEYHFAGYSISHIIFNYFSTGYNLNLLLDEIDKRMLFMLRLKNELIYNNLAGLKIILSNLSGRTGDIESFNLIDLNEKNLLLTCDDKKLFLPYAFYVLFKSFLFYIYGNYEEAIQLQKNFKEISTGLLGTFHMYEFHFFHALSLAALARENSEYISLLEEQALFLKQFSTECPENFLCRHLLIEAEKNRLNNDIPGAMTLYDMTIASARENGFIYVEAIACERAGIFWISLNKQDFASIYIKQSYTLYGRWGASAKQQLMITQYPGILNEHPVSDNPADTEILTLMNSFNELSFTPDINILLKTVSTVMLQHSGADRFSLLTEDNGRMLIQAVAVPGPAGIQLMNSLPVEECGIDLLPAEMFHYISRTAQPEAVYDGSPENIFYNSGYLKKYRPQSAFCLRTDAGIYRTILYFENSTVKDNYTGIKKTQLTLLAKQAAICLQNALNTRKFASNHGISEYVFKTTEGIKKIPYEKILYFTSSGRHTSVFSAEESYDIPLLLKDVEKEIPAEIFFRTHKQHIININNLSGLKRDTKGNFITGLKGGAALPVGRAYITGLKKRLKQLSDY